MNAFCRSPAQPRNHTYEVNRNTPWVPESLACAED